MDMVVFLYRRGNITTNERETLLISSENLPMSILSKFSFKDQAFKLRENAILDATTSVLGSKGYDLMTMDDVAGAVGISKPSLYKHFKSKEELVGEAMIRLLDGAIEQVAGWTRRWGRWKSCRPCWSGRCGCGWRRLAIPAVDQPACAGYVDAQREVHAARGEAESPAGSAGQAGQKEGC
jgi:AcrR family transcriptional regulator